MESYYRLQHEVDLDSAGKLRSDLLDLVNGGSGDIVVDCVNLEFIDSIGVAVLGQIRRLLSVHDRELRMVNISPQARRPFDLLGHADYFGLPDTRADDGTETPARPGARTRSIPDAQE
jgi:anti-anti-sigma factor